MSLKDLIGKSLKDFQVIEMTEVYAVNEDGCKSKSIGFFRDPKVAGAFAKAQIDAAWYKTEKKFVLTDGNVGYVIDTLDSVKMMDDEKETLELRKKIFEKLSPEERAILGVGK